VGAWILATLLTRGPAGDTNDGSTVRTPGVTRLWGAGSDQVWSHGACTPQGRGCESEGFMALPAAAQLQSGGSRRIAWGAHRDFRNL